MDADILRYLLIVVGAILLLALYLWERSQDPRMQEDLEEADSASSKRDPGFGGLDDASADVADSIDAESSWAGDARVADAGHVGVEVASQRPEPLLIQLSVVETGAHFSGIELLQAAARCGLEPGAMDIFHSSSVGGGGFFSMANMVKPGTFPFNVMDTFESPGLMLFTQLDGRDGDMEVMDEMLAAARHLATTLGGEVLDDTRKPLTVNKEETLRARILDHQLRSGA